MCKAFFICRFLKIILLYSIVISCSSPVKNISEIYSVVPVPKQIQAGTGYFNLNSSTRLIAAPKLKFSGDYLRNRIDLLTGIKILTSSDHGENSNRIFLKLDDAVEHPEGYKLVISPKGILISGKNEAGIFYGIQTLLQMITSVQISEARINLQSVSINDYPDLKWRGMHLDVSRHFFPAKDIKKYIDILALHKINVFHWHLTDDQGWRIEIKKYPKLTLIGAWRENRNNEVWNLSDDQRKPLDSPEPYGGFYTRDEIRDIVAYAAKNHITIIPEIELPGHSAAALTAYPEYSCFGYQKKVPCGGYVGENWDFSDPYCAGNEKTFEFLQDILDEVLELFPSEYIHIGGDECSKRRWSQCTKCRERIKNEGLKDEFELQSYFIQRIEKYLNKKGRKIIGWEEILEGGINPSAVIMPWKAETALDVGLEAAKAGHKIVMASSEYLYFNKHWPNEKKIQSTSLDLRTVYSYNPVSSGQEKKYSKSITGLEACVWTEHINNLNDVEYQSLPRMAALAETGWSNAKERNFSDFERRLENLKNIYRKMELSYYVPSPIASSEKKVFTDSTPVRLTVPGKDLIIRYTTNGEDPAKGAKTYRSEFYIDKSTTLKAAAFDNSGQRSKIRTLFLEKQKYRRSEDPGELKHGIEYQLFTGKIRSAAPENALLIKSGITKEIGLTELSGQPISAIRFKGFIKIPETGIYTFYLASNDGSILKIGDTVVVNHDGFHRAFTTEKDGSKKWLFKSGEIALEKGYQPFSLNYFKWGKGDKDIRLFIEAPHLRKQNADSSMLFH
jgi:hexosaminidase